jgi:hypothetical protein
LSRVRRTKNLRNHRSNEEGEFMDKLQNLADEAAINKNVDLYILIRETMKGVMTGSSLSDFIIPDVGDFDFNNWKDSDGNLLSFTPNDALLHYLLDSTKFNAFVWSDLDQVKTILRNRGYNDDDILLAQFFGFVKDDDGWSETGNGTRIFFTSSLLAAIFIEEELEVKIDSDARREFMIDNLGFGNNFEVLKSKQQVSETLEKYKARLLSK